MPAVKLFFSHLDQSLQVLPSVECLAEVRGLTNHSGWTAMDTSFHRGWLLREKRVRSVAMFFCLNGAS